MCKRVLYTFFATWTQRLQGKLHKFNYEIMDEYFEDDAPKCVYIYVKQTYM